MRALRVPASGHPIRAIRRVGNRPLLLEALEDRSRLYAASFSLPPARSLWSKAGELLSAPKVGPALNVALDFLSSHAGKLGVNPEDVSDARISDQYTDPSSGITHLYLKQQVNGLDVINADLN